MNKSSLQLIREAAKDLTIVSFLDCREYIAAIYQQVKENSSRYSYIKFAEDLGYGRTNKVRLIIVGERALTERAAKQFANRLELKGDERRFWLKLVKYTFERKPSLREEHFASMMEYKHRLSPKELNDQMLRYFGEWYFPVIREMVGLATFRPDPEWIRNNMNFPMHLTEIKRSLDMLVELGFVKFDRKTQTYKKSAEKIQTPIHADSLGLIRYQQRMMDIAKDSLTRIDASQREVSCITACISKKAFQKMQVKVQQLMDEMETLEEIGQNEQVYHLNVQLFPFSKEKPSDDA